MYRQCSLKPGIRRGARPYRALRLDFEPYAIDRSPATTGRIGDRASRVGRKHAMAATDDGPALLHTGFNMAGTRVKVVHFGGSAAALERILTGWCSRGLQYPRLGSSMSGGAGAAFSDTTGRDAPCPYEDGTARSDGSVMTITGFDSFWTQATDLPAPFPYQRRLATEPWPDLLRVPTGLGKTAAVTLAWLYKRLQGDPETPRRLVYCLPMRTLVEQTARNARGWIGRLAAAGVPGLPEVHVLMGGEADDAWILHPERPAILVGTQDLLVSRALMRGYGVSRGRWPIDFALLHNDALWVLDEAQLMAAALPTSAQLEAFRRALGTTAPCRSLWMSATLEADWLATVDLARTPLEVRGLDPRDRIEEKVRERLEAPKDLAPAATRLDASALKAGGLLGYARALADEIAAAHRPARTTLVVVNRVARAQALFDALRERLPAAAPLLVHSRFRPAERQAIEARLAQPQGPDGRVVIATQAVEAGVDMTSAVLFTELAPWPSLVQRLGRLNRRGEEPAAQALWIDAEADEKTRDALALPYAADDLDAARRRLADMSDASPRALEPIPVEIARDWQVLRRKDLLALFDTDPDLTGFDVDVSPYVRGADDTDIRVFWRAVEIDGRRLAGEPVAPRREELCAIPLGQGRDWLGSRRVRGRAFVWDWVGRAWAPFERPWPGATILVDSAVGGYDAVRGFDPGVTAAVPVVAPPGRGALPESDDDDRHTESATVVALDRHLLDVEAAAADLCPAVGLPGGEAGAVVTAALWHDVGKAHDVFKARCGLEPADPPLAKTPGYDWRVRDVRAGENGVERDRNRRHFRHELASALAWLAHGPADMDHDLVAYLIAAHHGKVRLGIRALPDERAPVATPGARFARGVHDGDMLPAIEVDGRLSLPETMLSLDVMEIGGGASGGSWAARTAALLERYGPFRLAFLEALVRLADWRASGDSVAEGGVGEDGHA